ncbi:MAG: hypothetical protein IJL71_03245 [Oscillospiraceae bacterium]|nr:hypothetical protein [Oscillospiraceae bacterium]
MRSYLDKIREPDKTGSLKNKILISAGLAILGFFLGILQKWLDGKAINELPFILQRIDIVNFFGRLGIWILLATVISVYSRTPLRASVNTFLFLISMVAGYYLYSHFVSGFLPVRYMMVWVAISFASLFLAYICWYAKGEGIPAVVISAVILGVLFSQAFLITQGFFVTHFTEVVLWIIGLAVLFRKPKEFAAVLALSVAVAFVYQTFIPYWG